MLSLIDLDNLEFIDHNLRKIVREVQDFFGVPLIVTSLYRIDDSGVHGSLPLRGIDARCRDARMAEPIKEFVDFSWQYDPHRIEMTCCMAHDPGGGFHLHFQTHPRTQRLTVPV